MEGTGLEAEMIALVGQLRGVVGARYPDPASVAALRWRIAERLLLHCERRDGAPTAVSEEIAARRRADHAALCCVFAHYIADWSVSRIAAEWAQFGGETEDVVAALLGVVLSGDAEAPEERRAA